ncbi:MAG: YARHG domain-containing protein [Dysgonomonas sp.]
MLFAVPSLYALDLSREKLTDEILSLVYENELDLMRNEIFARKGYVF